jgi:predicted nucleotide-binding protein
VTAGKNTRNAALVQPHPARRKAKHESEGDLQASAALGDKNPVAVVREVLLDAAARGTTPEQVAPAVSASSAMSQSEQPHPLERDRAELIFEDLADHYVKDGYRNHKAWNFSPGNDDERHFAKLRAYGLIKQIGARGSPWVFTDKGQHHALEWDRERSAKRGKSPMEKTVPDSRKVFVVHGRNDGARRAIFAFLRALGVHPLEWNDAVALTKKGSPYIGEVIDAGFAEAQAVVVLFTGDDEARLRPELRSPSESDEQLTPQARPNVIFEAGMAMGRHPERTILVELGATRGFSDIGGRHAIRMDGSRERRNDLAARLKGIGCEVNQTGNDWMIEGDFEVALKLSLPK